VIYQNDISIIFEDNKQEIRLQEINKIIAETGINHIDSKGNTLLLCAIEYSYNDIVRYLVDEGADVNGNRRANYYPLELAALTGNMEVIKYLEQTKKLKYHRKTDYSIIFASTMGNCDILNLLISKGVDINKKYKGMASVHWAVQEGQFASLQILCSNGANINDISEDGQTPLYISAAENNMAILKYLIMASAEIDLTKDTTPFMISCILNHFDIANELLNSGANVNHRDCDGRTAIFYAKLRNDKKLYDYLITKGASINIKDNHGLSVLDLGDDSLRNKIYNELY
jgi:ankyrin repeat protein